MFSVCRRSMITGFLQYSRNYSFYTKVYPIIKCTPNLRNGNDYKNYLAIHNFIVNDTIRTYSKKASDDGCPPAKKDTECKPKRIQPCAPQKDCDKKQLPYLQECARPNLMSDCPKPECRVDEPSDNKSTLMLALLGLAASLAALFYFMSSKNECKPTPQAKKKKVLVKENQGAEEPCRIIFRDPKNSSDIPNNVPYLLVGGGTAAFSAYRAIKTNDPTAKVLVVTNEEFYPYMRPPLSKELWYSGADNTSTSLDFKQWNGNVRSLFYEPIDFYLNPQDLMVSDNGGVSVARGWNISHLDVNNKKAILDDGYEICYDKVLIATGSTPKSLELFEKADDCVKAKVTSYKTAKDYQCILEKIKTVKCVTIIGGGFLGSELACSLAKRAKEDDSFKVNQVFRESGPLGSILPQYLSNWAKERVEAEGVEVHANCDVISATSCEKSVTLKLSNGKHVTTELVIVCIGSNANTDMAKASCLEVDPDIGGYLVNTELQARSNVYVAGDAACYYDTCFGRRRIEHHDNAVISGRLAGENMTGASKAYTHQSMFWSDIGSEVSLEAVGIVHSSLPTVGVFAKAHVPEVAAAKPKETKEPAEKEVPNECMQYLPKEEEERLRQAKAEKEERLRLDAEEKSKAEAARAEAMEKAKTQEYNRGVLFYLKDDIIVGILLWNVFNRLPTARQVLKDKCKYDDLNEVAKLFKIHEED